MAFPKENLMESFFLHKTFELHCKAALQRCLEQLKKAVTFKINKTAPDRWSPWRSWDPWLIGTNKFCYRNVLLYPYDNHRIFFCSCKTSLKTLFCSISEHASEYFSRGVVLEAQVRGSGGSGLWCLGGGVQTDWLHPALLPLPCHYFGQ